MFAAAAAGDLNMKADYDCLSSERTVEGMNMYGGRQGEFSVLLGSCNA